MAISDILLPLKGRKWLCLVSGGITVIIIDIRNGKGH